MLTKKEKLYLLCFVLVVAYLILLSPTIIRVRNELQSREVIAHEETNIFHLRQIERQARALITQYNTDKQTFLAFRDSEVQEERNWANMARIRANQTVNTFHELMINNTGIIGMAIDQKTIDSIQILE